MTIMSKIKKGIATGLLALAGILPAAAQDWEAAPKNPESGQFSGRARVECSGNLENRIGVKTTFGVGAEGIYEKPTPIYGQFVEMARAYDFWGRNEDNDETHYSAFGARFNLSLHEKNDSDVLISGCAGDREGYGVEAWHDVVRGLKIGLTGEHGEDNDTTRVGGELRCKASEPIEFALGYDEVDKNGDEERQFYGSGIFDWTKNDAIGAAFVRTETDEKNSNRVGCFYIHHGKDIPMAFRAFSEFSWDDEGNRSNRGQIVVAQNPNLGKAGACMLIDRRASQDGTYNLSPFPLSVSDLEMIRINDRSKDGFAGRFVWMYSDNKNSNSGYFGGVVGYTLPNAICGADMGASLEAIRYFDSEKKDYTIITPSIVLRKWGIDIDLAASINPEDNNQNTYTAGVQVRF